jgi:hypothetical protein
MTAAQRRSWPVGDPKRERAGEERAEWEMAARKTTVPGVRAKTSLGC